MTVESTTGLLRIGKVCDQLRDEFPDISVSKLRFLADKGIVVPSRTHSGYRMYSADQVDAIRQALRMQRDEFLPLKIIKAELAVRLQQGRDGADSRASASSGGAAPTLTGVISDAARRAARARNSVSEMPSIDLSTLTREADVAPEFVDDCRANDIIVGVRDDEGVHRFSTDDVEMVKLAASLQRLGIDVRHLRQTVAAMARQGALIEQLAATSLRAPGDAVRERALADIDALTSQLSEFMRIAFVRDVRESTQRITGTGPASRGGASAHQNSAQAAKLL